MNVDHYKNRNGNPYVDKRSGVYLPGNPYQDPRTARIMGPEMAGSSSTGMHHNTSSSSNLHNVSQTDVQKLFGHDEQLMAHADVLQQRAQNRLEAQKNTDGLRSEPSQSDLHSHRHFR